MRGRPRDKWELSQSGERFPGDFQICSGFIEVSVHGRAEEGKEGRSRFRKRDRRCLKGGRQEGGWAADTAHRWPHSGNRKP